MYIYIYILGTYASAKKQKSSAVQNVTPTIRVLIDNNL